MTSSRRAKKNSLKAQVALWKKLAREASETANAHNHTINELRRQLANASSILQVCNTTGRGEMYRMVFHIDPLDLRFMSERDRVHWAETTLRDVVAESMRICPPDRTAVFVGRVTEGGSR